MATLVDKNISADEALARLRAGNERFVRHLRSLDSLLATAHRAELAAGQSPFAIVLGCSDSRVPAEIVFDCGLGDLFVVRVAGNVVAPSLVGSVEFAAVKFDTQLVVVMGHSQCGAIDATVNVLKGRAPILSDNVDDIVDRIAPAIKELVGAGLPDDRLIPAAIRANVRASVSHLRHGSRILEKRVSAGQLLILGAEYSLETGVVSFLD